MKLTAKDVSAIRLPALAFVIAVAAAVALVQFWSDQRRQAEMQHRDLSAALQEARIRLHRSGEERERILLYLPTYRELQKQGMVGTEQRINWLEGLRTANAQTGLFGVDYELGAQEPFPYAGKENPLAGRIYHSRMKLSFGVVHEGDLIRFFRVLAAQQVGMFALTGCILDRPPGAGSPKPRQPNLSAQCDLSWLTIDPGKGGG